MINFASLLSSPFIPRKKKIDPLDEFAGQEMDPIEDIQAGLAPMPDESLMVGKGLADYPDTDQYGSKLEEMEPLETSALEQLKAHIASRPRRDQHKAGLGKTLLSGLAAGLAGAASRDPEKGARLGLGMKERGYNQANEEWMMEGGKLKDLAAIEERSNLGKENARIRQDELVRREKADKDQLEVRREEIQRRIDASNDANEIKKLQLEQNRLYQESLNAIRREGIAQRREAANNKGEEKLNATNDKVKLRNQALNESLGTIAEIKKFIYADDDHKPEKAKDLHGTLGGWDSGVRASGLAQTIGLDKEKASRLKALVGRLKTEYLYEKSGKAITKNEMDRLEQFIITSAIKNPKEFAHRLDEFERTVKSMIRNDDGTYGQEEDEYTAWKKAKGLQ